MTTAAACLAAGMLLAATGACGYYALLTTLGWWPRRPEPTPTPGLRLAVLVPAHDEEATVATAVRSVLASGYPRGLLEVVVVADNCADATARVARAAGATCLERTSLQRGKGHALAWGLPQVLAGGAGAVLVLDADCRVAPGSLAQLASAVGCGAGAAQAALRVDPRPGAAGLVAGVGAELDNAVSAGRDRLGGSAALRGTGMLLARGTLEAHPWGECGLAEDAEYAARLARAGVRVRFCPGAVVSTAAPPTAEALSAQRRRWRAALTQSGPGRLHRAVASKPLVLVQLAATAALVALAAPLLPAPLAAALAGWLLAVVAATGAVYGRAASRAGAALGGPLGLLRAGAAVIGLAGVALAGLAGRRELVWARTARVASGEL